VESGVLINFELPSHSGEFFIWERVLSLIEPPF
jgi:hypothetical protein